ncbi:MAG: hypothetical protein Q4E39_00820 [bacterium]|nr:hypothetical protein [bacterium]
MIQEEDFILRCDIRELLKNKSSFFSTINDEYLAILHFYDDNVSCYLTYHEDDENNKDKRFQINFCIDNEDMFLVDYILIEDNILKDQETLFRYMKESLNIFSSNIKQGKYNDINYENLGGYYFFDEKEVK